MSGEEEKEVLEQVLKLRDYGKEAVSGGRFADAVRIYSQALEKLEGTALVEQKQAVLSNRSMCFLRIESYDLALVDAREAVGIDPSWMKAHHRWYSICLMVARVCLL